jgi:hypothetical protein
VKSLIILGLAAAYLAGHLLMIWHSRNAKLPPRPPGGWKQSPGWDDEDDWPKPAGEFAPHSSAA